MKDIRTTDCQQIGQLMGGNAEGMTGDDDPDGAKGWWAGFRLASDSHSWRCRVPRAPRSSQKYSEESSLPRDGDTPRVWLAGESDASSKNQAHLPTLRDP